MRTYLELLATALRNAVRSKHELVLENLALRQQLAVLTRQRSRARTKPADRLLYRSWFLGHFARGNHAAAPVLGESAWRTAAGVGWPWRSTSHFWL